jgi:tetratricopeptide (TPR) repeat protein
VLRQIEAADDYDGELYQIESKGISSTTTTASSAYTLSYVYLLRYLCIALPHLSTLNMSLKELQYTIIRLNLLSGAADSMERSSPLREMPLLMCPAPCPGRSSIPAIGIAVALALFLSAGAWADVKKPRIGKDTPEGNFLELVALEIDAGKKIVLLEQFVTIFPQCDPAILVWVYADLQERYRKAGNLDKAVAAGEKALAVDPNNIEIARATWRIVEAKGDAALIKKWTEETANIAERIVNGPLPSGSDSESVEMAQQRIEFASQFVRKTEYQEFSKAIAIAIPAERIAALEAFVKQRPQNPYTEQIEVAEFVAYREMGDVDKTLAAAEKLLSHNYTRDDALLFVADVTFRRRKDPKKALELASKLIERSGVAEKPEGVSDQDWATAKKQNLARAHYIIGRIHFDAQRWPLADRSLRASLPFVGDDQTRAAVFYDLGWTNYQMQNAVDAVKYYGLCAGIAGPMQEQASKNVISIKAEYHLP